MPIYEFKCRKCDNLFEILFRSSNEKIEVSCPSCKSKKVDRQMSVFGGKIGNTSAGGAGCSSCSATSCSTT
ncbi:MAG: zinc ribbon domain-containing protein [Deltaproteobacteria bacterium]|nr:zinc ribbon domain-containing protein [Deltaproteobacteria bacterium]